MQGLVIRCCMPLCLGATTDKTNSWADLLLLGFFVLPVEFDFVHQMGRSLGTVLQKKGKHKTLARPDDSDEH